MAKEHITITIKKAAELYVVGGVAFDPSVDKYVFWYAVRKYPIMSKKLQRETGTKSKTEYIQKFRPEWTTEGEVPPPEYEQFYRKLPEVFEEGAPEQIEKTRPELARSTTIIEPTKIEYGVSATGSSPMDVPVVVEIIKKIRELIWSFPVEGPFTTLTGLQGDKLRQFINSNLKRAYKNMRLRKCAENFQIVPESTRYIDVATGTIHKSEEAARQAIREYHTEPELMLAAASKGGTEMNVGELLKIADMLDESGDFESADEIAQIIKLMVAEKKVVTASSTDNHEKAWLGQVINTLVKVADSLEAKGALKEAQFADNLLEGLKESLPQAFTAQPSVAEPMAPAVPATIEVTETATETAVMEPPAVQDIQPVAESTTPVTTEAPKVETPFSNLPEEAKNPQEVKIEEPKEPQPQFDEVSIDEFKNIIQGMKLRHSQGAQRQKYEQILQHVEKAQEYFKAYKEWSDYAHSLFGDEPIRIKIE